MNNYDRCIYCHQPGCELGMCVHAVDCPESTGVFPVGEVNAGIGCVDCGELFDADEFYTLRPVCWNVSDILCLGCAVLQRTV